MILIVLFAVVMLIWGMTHFAPQPVMQQYTWAPNWLAWLSVLFLGLYVFVPALRVGP